MTSRTSDIVLYSPLIPKAVLGQTLTHFLQPIQSISRLTLCIPSSFICIFSGQTPTIYTIILFKHHIKLSIEAFRI